MSVTFPRTRMGSAPPVVTDSRTGWSGSVPRPDTELARGGPPAARLADDEHAGRIGELARQVGASDRCGRSVA
jgi:hypothetical protein